MSFRCRRVLRAPLQQSRHPQRDRGSLLDLRPHGLPAARLLRLNEGNPIVPLKFLAFGEGDTAPVCREVLRQAEPDRKSG
jgi:hypothetical protein